MAKNYKPGHFLAVVRRPSRACPEGWPPRFVPTIQWKSTASASAHATAAVEAGIGWGETGGTIKLERTPDNPKPKWIGAQP